MKIYICRGCSAIFADKKYICDVCKDHCFEEKEIKEIIDKRAVAEGTGNVDIN